MRLQGFVVGPRGLNLAKVERISVGQKSLESE